MAKINILFKNLQYKITGPYSKNKQQMQKDKQVIYKLKCISMISLLFMTVEIAGGIMANSIAILADAFHLLSDVLAYIISLQAVIMSHKKPPFFMTFGYEKIQPLGALINVAIIWFVTLQLVIEATERLINKSVVEDPLYMLLTSFFGLGCNLYIMKVLHSDTEHGGHQGCSHSHGLEHHHQHKQGQKCSHDHDHDHSHSHNHNPVSKKHVHAHKKQNKKKCSHGHHHEHNHDHTHQHHEHNETEGHVHQHEENHHDHDHQHDHDHDHGEHKHSSTCSHNHGSSKVQNQLSPTDSFREIMCTIDHDHVQDPLNCNSTKPTDTIQGISMSQQISSHISYKPDSQMNLSDQNLRIAQKQKARRQLFKNINIQAAYIHILTDIILSIGVIISAIIIFFNADPTVWTKCQLFDPLCTYLFSVMAIYSTIGITKDAVIILLDGCDDQNMLKDIISQLDSMEDIQKYQELRVWSLNRSKFAAAVKIYLAKNKYEDAKTRDEIRDRVTSLFSTRKISYYVQMLQDNTDEEQMRLKPQ